MDTENVLNSLQKRKNSLKSELLHDRLKRGTYSFDHSRKHVLTVLNCYKNHESFFKVSSIVGIAQKELLNWYVQGQMGNPRFRGFYLAVNEISRGNGEAADEEVIPERETDFSDDGGYVISEYGDGWSYTAYIGGEKIFIISDDLKTLKKKVRDKRLPLD